ncbi:MAG: hypothetical protein PVF68_13975 [Acidobacteriota bacterium]
MDDPPLVGDLEPHRDLPGDLEDLLHRKRALGEPLGEIRPLHQLQHQPTGAVRLLHAVDGADIGVVERGEHLRLALEAGQAFRARGHLVR